MPKKMRAGDLLVLWIVMSAQGAALAAPSFTGIGVAPSVPGYYPQGDVSLGRAISDDGVLVVGDSWNLQVPVVQDSTPIKWSEATGSIARILCYPGFDEAGIAVDVSVDRSVIVGTCEYWPRKDPADPDNVSIATVWNVGVSTTALWRGYANAVSGDGQIVVGDDYTGANPAATRWNAASGLSETLVANASAGDVSDDGSVVIGRRNAPINDYYRWENGVVTSLGSTYPATALSGDGLVIFGGNARWTESTGWVVLDPAWDAHLVATNFDGSFAVGYSSSGAVVWDGSNGYRLMRDVIGEWGISTQGWRLDAALGVSRDGTAFTGYGANTQRDPEGWHARLSGTPIPNNAPIANADNFVVAEDNELILGVESTVLNNDTDADGDALNARLLSSTSNGVLNFAEDGSFSYQPNYNFFGSDSFVYVANDWKVNSDAVTVTIDVTPVNDPPNLCLTMPVSVQARVDANYDASCSSDVDGTIVSYVWDFGDGSKVKTTTAPEIVHKYRKAGVYRMTLSITDDGGASSTTERDVTVTP